MTCNWGLMQNADRVHSTMPIFVSVNPQNSEAGTVPLLQGRELWREAHIQECTLLTGASSI